MLNYTCAKCNVELRCKKNGVMLVHYTNNDKNQGIDVVRYGDLWVCPKCGCEVVLGMGCGQTYGYEIDNKHQKSIMESNRTIEVKRYDEGTRC